RHDSSRKARLALSGATGGETTLEMKDERKPSSDSSFLLPPSSFLVRHWFLVALLLGLGLAALRPDWLRPLTARVPPRGVVGLALFIMAWGLESRSLWRA